MLGVTVMLFLLMTLTAGIFTGCGKNAGGGVDGTESSGTNADGSAGGGKGRFIESKVALPEEINSILQFKALSDGTLEVVGQDADYSIYVAKSSDGGGSWETTPLEDISYGDVAVAEDGTVAFLDYTENGLCPVTIVDADGSTHTFSIEMPAEDAVVSVAAFDSNKQLIVRDTLGGLYGIDCTDGSKTVTFEIDEDTYIPYFDVVGTNCYIVTSDKVLCYDTTTGKETDELTALNSKEGMDGVKSAPDVKEYELTDIVGKAGIEKVMEEYLQGTKGYETVFVDRMGREVEVLDHVDATAGNDVYLTIDSKLQADAYNILEKFVAGILVDKIINVKNYDSTDVSSANLKIPIDNVYSALFKNNVIELSKMEAAVEGETQYSVYQTILSRRDEVLTWLSEELLSGTIAYQSLPAEYKAYESYIINNLLPENNILSGVDKTDQTYIDWTTNETISIREYLEYAISKNWIDVTQLPLDGKYSDSSEVYQQLVSYILEELDSQTFLKKLIPYMIEQNRITGTQVCILLIEQDVINPTENQIAELKSGSVSAFNFMVNLIRNLEITPAQLALDPYSASCVLTDVNTGEVRALVSYPSYDNNRLANGIDAEYYSRISSGEDLSRPMWNYATQMRTAPGSTFKMVSSTAALMEHVIDLTTRIECPGIFTRFSDYQPRCWKRSGHGSLNVSEAITNSCNVFFYEVGYQLGLNGDKYDQDLGNEKLAKYASMYGLNEKSGIEIEESEPQISDALSVVSAIGQGTNNFTTVGLARYVTTVANSGTCYDLTLLDKVTDTSGNLLVNYSANVRNTIDMPQSYWNAIHQGMRGVVQNKKYYQDFGVEVAGKTGTAETEAAEFMGTYKLGVLPIPTNKPMIRQDNDDLIFRTKKEKLAAIVKDVAKRYHKGQPVLLGTASVESSEVVSSLLDVAKIPHQVLNAKQHEQEAAEAADMRHSQVRSLDRSERIRTYNFPENRIVDHRTNYKAYNLDAVLNGDLQAVIDSDIQADEAERLANQK